MAEKLSPWCKKAKIAMIQKDIGVSDMAEKLGNNRSYISSVLNGRVVSPPIRKRISDYLNGKREITLNVAKALHQKLNIDGDIILQ